MQKKARDDLPNRYRIFLTDEFLKNLTAARTQIGKIEKKLNVFVFPQLRNNPHFGLNIKRLKGCHSPVWRYRVGDWRFFYEINERKKIVCLIAAHHRREAYR